MSNMIILPPLAPAALTVVNSVGAPLGSGGANLLTPDPKEVWNAGTIANAYVTVDLGSAQLIDSFFLGFTNLTPLGRYAFETGVAAHGETVHMLNQVPIAATAGRQHIFRRLPAPVNARYLRMIVGSNPVAVQAGIFLAGLAFQTTWNREWGGGRRVIDTGLREALRGGGFGIGEGARKAAYAWTWGDLTDAEVEGLYAIAIDRGETAPVLVAEDPDNVAGINERLHYGLFTRFEQFERQAPGRSRWSLQVEQWV